MVRKKPATLLPSATTSTRVKPASRWRNPAGRKRQHSSAASMGQALGTLSSKAPPGLSTRWISPNTRDGCGNVFEHLRTNHQVKSRIAQWKLFPASHHIHQRSQPQIYCDVSAQAIRDQWAIRLNPSANIKNFKFIRRQLRQPAIENPAPLSQNEPIRIGERGEKTFSALLRHFVQSRRSIH